MVLESTIPLMLWMFIFDYTLTPSKASPDISIKRTVSTWYSKYWNANTLEYRKCLVREKKYFLKTNNFKTLSNLPIMEEQINYTELSWSFIHQSRQRNIVCTWCMRFLNALMFVLHACSCLFGALQPLEYYTHSTKAIALFSIIMRSFLFLPPQINFDSITFSLLHNTCC